ncbi:MAG: zf-HC2 domain-containing protein [Vicinamibacterales bacterium]
MISRDAAVRRARRALEATAGADAAPEHPGYELLEAYVDGRLDAEDRARVEALAAQSVMVAEDLADLAALRDAVVADAATAARARPQSVLARRVAMVVGLAASLALVVWAGSWMRGGKPEGGGKPLGLPTASRLTRDEQTLVAQRIANGRLNPPEAIVALAAREETLLGSPATPTSFGAVAPTGTAVLSTRPMFEWSAGNADRYTIEIFDEAFAPVARGDRVSGTSWTPAIDLRRGATYRWQVTAHRASGDVTAPAPPQPEAHFAVLDAGRAAMVSEQRARLANEPLALGILLAEAGLLNEARVELEKAQTAPSTAGAAKILMQSLGAR